MLACCFYQSTFPRFKSVEEKHKYANCNFLQNKYIHQKSKHLDPTFHFHPSTDKTMAIAGLSHIIQASAAPSSAAGYKGCPSAPAGGRRHPDKWLGVAPMCSLLISSHLTLAALLLPSHTFTTQRWLFILILHSIDPIQTNSLFPENVT